MWHDPKKRGQPVNTDSILLHGPDGGVAQAHTDMKAARERWAEKLGVPKYITPCMTRPEAWDGGLIDDVMSNADSGKEQANACLDHCHVLTECERILEADRQGLTVGYRSRGNGRRVPPRPTMAGIPRVRHPLDTEEMGGE